VRPVRLLLRIFNCNLILSGQFKYVRIGDSIVDDGVGYQMLVPEDGEFLDRGKVARHFSQNLGR